MSFLESLFKTAKEATFHPAEGTKKQSKTYKEPFLYISVISGIVAAASAVITFLILAFVGMGNMGIMGMFIQGNPYSTIAGTTVSLLIAIPIAMVLGPIVALIGAIILQAFGKLFRFYKYDLLRTYNAVAYAYSPTLFFGWIPVVSIIGAVWSIIVKIYALSNQQKITKTKAFLSLLIPFIIIVAIFAALGILAFIYLLGIFGDLRTVPFPY